MITKVVMPKLSDAMETGKVIKWLKKEGDAVKGGDVIAEIETDKANVEIEAFGTGVLRKILVGEGGQVPVGELIGVIADPAEDVSGVAVTPAKPAPPPAPAPASAAPRPTPVPAAAPAGPLPAMESYRSVPATTAVVTMAPAAESIAAPAGGRVKASPLARKIAGQTGVDLRLIQGTGPGGRIIRRDVEAAQAVPPPAPAPAISRPAAAGAPPQRARPEFIVPPRPEVEFEDVPMSPMRAAIAKRMPMSKAPVPHFYVTSEVDMDPAWALREQLNGLEGQPKISVTDMVIKATALALLKNPGVNAQLNGQAIRVHHRAHIGVAVALDQGLITPVLRDCEVKPLGRIAVEARDLAARARGGKLRAQEMSGATFSISNLGMFDVEEFSAIINPPEGAILAVGSVLQKPVVDDGEIRVGHRMKMTISCDHRVMDGAMGARFLQDLKRLLEEPLRLLV